MSDPLGHPPPSARFALCLIIVVYIALAICGIDWGLPGRHVDRFLFGSEPPWSGEKIYALAGAADRFSDGVGADVDVDPLARVDRRPIRLTETEAHVARIYLRYRLFTHQPDEMITMMALAGMKPGRLEFDPRLYQYGGLFIYPVGVGIRLCDILGLIDVRSDIAFYLDQPDQFGRFYLVSRGYAAMWGVVGVLVVGGIARRLAGVQAGLLAAGLFALMPVVVCMAHEGKPHLPGAVLMLLAVLFAMRHLAVTPGQMGRRDWWLMCVCCGAAIGMVLSSAPIVVLIPLVVWLDRSRGDLAGGAEDPPTVQNKVGESMVSPPGVIVTLRRTTVGGVVAAGVYLATNPYIVINLLTNREVLSSNFGNSLAMYEVSRLVEGFAQVVELMIEGATLPIVVLGPVALAVALRKRNRVMLPLLVSAGVFFVQFVAIGAAKPAEYGRFGVFPGVALAIATACLLMHGWPGRGRQLRMAASGLLILWVFLGGLRYLHNVHADTVWSPAGGGTRAIAARAIQARFAEVPEDIRPVVVVVGEPAPYGCPPMDFSRIDVVLCPSRAEAFDVAEDMGALYLEPVVRVPAGGQAEYFVTGRAPVSSISWANKPFLLLEAAEIIDGPGPLPPSALPDRLPLDIRRPDR